MTLMRTMLVCVGALAFGCNGETVPVASEGTDTVGWNVLAEPPDAASGPVCLGGAIPSDDAGGVPCVILETLPFAQDPSSPESVCTSLVYPGLSAPDPTLLAAFKAAQETSWKQGGSVGQDPSTLPTCQLTQLSRPRSQDSSTEDCQASSSPGWCYVPPALSPDCAQTGAILLAPGTVPVGAQLYLECNPAW
jgi:hypothetical protein